MAVAVFALLVSAEALPLRNKVALVTGASRGIGRATAIELGRAGATVYVTGRSLGHRERDDRPEGLSIVSTARAVTRAGGVGRPLFCDHAKDEDVKHVFDSIAGEEGGLDILVNNAFSTEVAREGRFREKFWVQGVGMWDGIMQVGLRGHYLCACEAVPLMLRRDPADGLIVQISSFGGMAYTFNCAYGVAKAALDRLTADMHEDLKGTGVRTVSLYPGLVRTEGNLQLLRDGEWDEASGGLDLAWGETPELTGRAVVKLATMKSEDLDARSGTVQVVAELAAELGFTEDDGSVPASIRSLRFLVPNYVLPSMRDRGMEVPGWVANAIPDIRLPWSFFKGGPPEDD